MYPLHASVSVLMLGVIFVILVTILQQQQFYVQSFPVSMKARSSFVAKCNTYKKVNPRSVLNHGKSPNRIVKLLSSTLLLQSSTNIETIEGTTERSNVKFDGTAIIKYGIAMAVQMGLISTVLYSFDRIVQYTNTLSPTKIPFLLNCIFFYGFALKSRIFNPMCNTRPKPRTLEVPSSTATESTTETSTTTSAASKKSNDVATMFRRNMPTWTPPGYIFPIVWLLLIGPLRAITTSMIYSRTKSYCCLPILAYIFHLSIGDVWNTINNIERRFGVATIGVYIVWLTKAITSYQYYIIDPMAGKLLSLSLVWLTIASALVTATWRLNPNPTTNQLEPLYPITAIDGKSITKFAWFSNNNKMKN